MCNRCSPREGQARPGRGAAASAFKTPRRFLESKPRSWDCRRPSPTTSAAARRASGALDATTADDPALLAARRRTRASDQERGVTIRPRSMSSAFKSWSINTRCSARRWTRRNVSWSTNGTRRKRRPQWRRRKSKRFGARMPRAQASKDTHKFYLAESMGMSNVSKSYADDSFEVQSDAGDESAPARKKPASPSPRKPRRAQDGCLRRVCLGSRRRGGAKRGGGAPHASRRGGEASERSGHGARG